MIVGLGIDLVELKRIERLWDKYGQRLAARLLCPEELAALPAEPVAYLAARFAAKEAAVKALGTGFTEAITLHDLYVRSHASGAPELICTGAAEERLRTLGGRRALLSLSHGRESAVAVVVLES